MSTERDLRSTLDESNALGTTTADVYETARSVPSTFELPIDDVKGYVNDLMIHQIGSKVLVDGQTEFLMLSDLEKIYTNLQSNMKNAVFLHTSVARRGSRIEFKNGAVAIVYTNPNDDLVSLSAKIVICNAKLTIYRPERAYDEDPNSPTYGDETERLMAKQAGLDVFIERINGEMRHRDVGLLHDTIMQCVTFQKDVYPDDGEGILVGDIIDYKGKYYEISDIDMITSGVTTLQMRSTRVDYGKWIHG